MTTDETERLTPYQREEINLLTKIVEALDRLTRAVEVLHP